MDNIKVNRYNNPEQVGYRGWIEPEDKSWIVFIPLSGKPSLFAARTKTGAVIV